MNSQTFGALGVPHPIVETLARDGKTTAFPIQAATLPDSLAGRDVLGRGRTGSGKTLAFGIPLVARLGMRQSATPRRPRRPLGLVLAPTRELASQIDAELRPLADAFGLRTAVVFGGVSQRPQVAALERGVDLVVACPGRLEDLMGQGAIRLDDVEITVLDEADHMADLGFLPGVTRIMNATPATGQRMLFSATLDRGVDKLVTRFLHEPVKHEVDEVEAPVIAMTHHVFGATDPAAKKQLVERLAAGTGRRVLFSRTKHHAKRLARDLTARGIPAVDLHGNLSQGQRERNLAAFADGSVRVLVATDIAARGVHVDEVELVVHVDPPAEHKAYLHRSGRTARAGAAGDVVTVVLPAQEREVADLLRKAGIRAGLQHVTAEDAAVLAVTGELAERVTPSPVVRTPQPAANGAGRRRGGQGRQGGPARQGGSARRGGSARQGGSTGQGGQARQDRDRSRHQPTGRPPSSSAAAPAVPANRGADGGAAPRGRRRPGRRASSPQRG